MFKDISGFATEGEGLDADTIRRNIYSEDDRPSTRQLVRRSFVEYAKMDVPSEETLLGNRWLCRGGGALIVAPSGQGKSVLTAQASILWGCKQGGVWHQAIAPITVPNPASGG